MSFLQAAFTLLKNLGGQTIFDTDLCNSCLLKPKITSDPALRPVRTVFHSRDMKIMHVCMKCWNDTLGSGDPDIIHLEVLAMSIREAKELAEIQKVMSG